MAKKKNTHWRESGRNGYAARLADLTELRRQLISITGVTFKMGASDDQKNVALVERVKELAALKAVVESEVRRRQAARRQQPAATG